MIFKFGMPEAGRRWEEWKWKKCNNLEPTIVRFVNDNMASRNSIWNLVACILLETLIDPKPLRLAKLL